MCFRRTKRTYERYYKRRKRNIKRGIELLGTEPPDHTALKKEVAEFERMMLEQRVAEESATCKGAANRGNKDERK